MQNFVFSISSCSSKNNSLTLYSMTTQDILQQAQDDFKKAVLHLKEEYSRLQIGRANSSLIENIVVEAYGVKQPLKALANISVPDPRTIRIQLWDKSIAANIEKALQISNLGLNAVNNGDVLRISFPPLTGEKRLELKKLVRDLAEKAKISVRNIRHELNSRLKDAENSKEIREDEFHNAEKKLQEKIDNVNQDIDKMAEEKEKDIMTV